MAPMSGRRRPIRSAGSSLSLYPEQRAIDRGIGMRRREVIEDAVGHLDNMVGNELRAVLGGDFRMLQAALPFVHRPALEIVRRQSGKDAAEVDLPVAERSVAAGALQPALVAAIYPLLCGRVEFRVLHMKHLDAFMIGVDE